MARKNSLYKPQLHECYHAKKNKNTGQASPLIGNIPFRRGQRAMFTQRGLNLASLACGVSFFGRSSSMCQVCSKPFLRQFESFSFLSQSNK